MNNPIFQRSELLLGQEAMEKIAQARVALFGLGGVGSWCAEALIRSGIHHLMIVDSDQICMTNINRQLQATSQNIGCSKVLELENRLKAINPESVLISYQKKYDYLTRADFPLHEYDYVIDAIDSLSDKVELILHCHDVGTMLFSAMGAACRLDPGRIQVDSIWNTQGCGLSRVVRKKLRKKNYQGDFLCVYSEEVLANKGYIESIDNTEGHSSLAIDQEDQSNIHSEERFFKQQINGSLVHITGIFGLTLASLVIQDLVKKASAEE